MLHCFDLHSNNSWCFIGCHVLYRVSYRVSCVYIISRTSQVARQNNLYFASCLLFQLVFCLFCLFCLPSSGFRSFLLRHPPVSITPSSACCIFLLIVASIVAGAWCCLFKQLPHLFLTTSFIFLPFSFLQSCPALRLLRLRWRRRFPRVVGRRRRVLDWHGLGKEGLVAPSSTWGGS